MSELNLRLQIEGQTTDVARTVTVDKNEFTIGRLPECDLHLPSYEISRYHARLLKTASGVWLIEDLGSTNGTRLNQQPLTSPKPVKHGDVIELGQIFLQVILASPTQPSLGQSKTSLPGVTILRSAKELQRQWVQPDTQGDDLSNHRQAIVRLQNLVDIAKALNSAESIEVIFSRVQAIVFRDLKIDRLALLVDVSGSGQLELLDAATKDASEHDTLAPDGSWISQSICQKVFAEQVAIKTADAQRDSRFEGEQSILVKGIRSAMAVPLWHESKVVGVLYGDAQISVSHWQKDGEEDLSFFSALANLVASSVQRWLLTQKLKNEETIRHRLERYHSPAVVQHLITVGKSEDGRISPAEGEISILFADLVGFTAMSERLSPVQIAQLLNSFFEEMLQEVFAAGGTLDKFIGDCIMAFFGAPEPQADHAKRAFAAAQGMLERLERLNAKKTWAKPLQLRIAINSGKAVVGDVGSSQRVDYTVLGATINLAARLEGICPPGECVISEVTYTQLECPSGFSEMGEHRFKGINRPIRVYQTHRH
jgi:adenylate cyclase